MNHAVFVWNSRYETGYDVVDLQHRHLVDLLNELGRLYASRGGDSDLRRVFNELAAYTVYHFATEETLMAEMAIAAEHEAKHRAAHAEFVKQVGEARQLLEREPMLALASLLPFLTRWLVTHILGIDRRMVAEVLALKAGHPPAEARRLAEKETADVTSVLLAAMGSLYDDLALRTNEYQQANQRLQQEIAERQRAEDALRQSRQQLERVIEGSDQSYWEWNLVTDEFSVSPRFETMLGYWVGEMKLQPSNWGAYVQADDLARAKISIDRHLRGELPIHEVEFRCRTKAGDWRWIRTRGRVIEHDAEGRPLMMSGTHTDISEHKRNEAELESYRKHLEELVEARTRELSTARDQATSANRAKSAFLANISHELRTPLNHIMGFAALLQRDVPSDGGQVRLASIIDASRHLLGMINDILDISKIEAEQIEIEPRSFALQSLFDQVENELTENRPGKYVDLVYEIAPEVPAQLYGDPRRLGQVLVRLLDNAIKFSEGKTVMLRVCLDQAGDTPPRLRFEVIDHGIGIAPELQTGLFQLFNQGDNSMARRFGGTGLGLALCKRLSTLMGGDIGFTSLSGQGSTFWFSLPLAAETPSILPSTPPEPVDWEDLASGVSELVRLLSDGDVEARLLWNTSPERFRPLLREQFACFRSAIENFDFELAQQILQSASDQTPELFAHRSA